MTVGTDVRFNGGVGEAVTGEVTRLTERPLTNLTLKGLFSCVDPLQHKNKNHIKWGTISIIITISIQY